MGSREPLALACDKADLDLARRLPHPWPAQRALQGPEVPCLNLLPRRAERPARRRASPGVRTRRILAVCLDLVLVSLLVALLWTASIVLTLGLALFFLPPLWPIVAFFYNGLTVSGAKMATPGMRAMDLEMRMHDTGQRVPFVNAAVHAVLFYVSWFFPPIFLVSLVDSEKRCLHDILAGVVSCGGSEIRNAGTRRRAARSSVD